MCTVPKLDVLGRQSIISLAARWRSAKRLEDTSAIMRPRGSTTFGAGVAAAQRRALQWKACQQNNGATTAPQAVTTHTSSASSGMTLLQQSGGNQRDLRVGSQCAGEEACGMVRLRRSFEQPQHHPGRFHLPSYGNESWAGQGREELACADWWLAGWVDSAVTEGHGLLNIGRPDGARCANRCEQDASGARTTRSCCTWRPLWEAKSTLQVVISCFGRCRWQG